MKNFTFLAIVLFSVLSLSSSAQVKRCITEEKMEELFRTDPSARQRFEATRKALDERVAKYLSGQDVPALLRTNAIISVPVVVHIATSNPALVTNAVVQAQIDTLNWYYGSQSATDSLRTYTPFRTAYGRSEIRFCMAQRDPAGLATNGITRTTTSVVFNTSSAHPSTVVPAWNTQLYLNMWVVDFGSSGVLGYSYKPGTFPAGDQRIGYVVDYRAFGAGASYLFPQYNLGKTGVHEIGHYFNLDHPWGPNNSGNPSCTLTDGCSDTPPTSGPTFGCPTTIPVLNACSPSAPGIMWQNHMDYADDACMVLFTKEQTAKMELALTTAPDRSTLVNSNGCQPLVAVANDAGIATIIAPTAAGITTCTSTTVPQITLQNYGTNNLTSVNITVTVNGVVQTGYPFAWTGNLAPNATVNLTLPAVNFVTGNNTIVISTSQPNGVADGNPTNDSKTVIANRPAALNLPVSEGFESTTFPPAPWSVVAVNATGTRDWVRNSPGNNSTGALYINNYLNSDGAIDDFRSANYAVGSTDSIRITFDVAYRPYAGSPDTLAILVSNNCGSTFSEIYKKWGQATSGPTSLSTVLPGNTSSFTPTSAADWRRETIVVPTSLLTGGQLQFIWRSKSRFGNNIWIDNINIEKVVARDLKLVSIVSPTGNICGNTVAPQVSVTNNGSETINSFTLSYTINGVAVTPSTVVNTPLAPGATTTVTLANGNVATGNVTIVVSVAAATFTSGFPEQETSNNTLTTTATVVQLRNFIQEGFEATPTGWTVFNPDANNTWVIVQPGRNSLRSAFINNYDNTVLGQIDDLRSPYLNSSNYDSVYVSFDVAHRPYTGANDSLIVFAVTGCGNNFVRTGYQKAGTTLATSAPLATSFLTPLASEWRRETIAIGRSVLGTGSDLLIAFRNRNDYGNNIFIDNVNIVPLFRRDLQLLSLNQPAGFACSTNITPSVTVKNNGTEAITGYKVQYSLDGGAPQTATVVTGVNIPRNGTATISLTAFTTTLGNHTIRVYSFDPVTASGTGDEYPLNDTLTRTFTVVTTVPAPLSESFVSNTFPPANWTVINPDGGITWRRYATGNGNAGSAYVNTYNYTSNNQRDDLLTPAISYSGVDSIRLTFDVAAATYSYPGTTAIPMDTLEVLATRDCGATFTTVYKKWGIDLQTMSAPNDPQTAEFFPTASNQWRTENLDLTQFAANSQLLFVFRVTNNFENNIFIDNVNLTTRTLPSQLKQQGYLVYPTAFRNNFTVWHYQTPSTVKYMTVVNSVGQTVWTRTFNGNADKQVGIDLTGKAAGVYFVNIGYTDANRNITQKVVKY